LLMENSPERRNTNTFSSCNSSHAGSGIFFNFSQYCNFNSGKSNCSRSSAIRRQWSKGPRFAHSLVNFGEQFVGWDSALWIMVCVEATCFH
jgi:hypothetical protein